jgi:hypothetical protein
MREETSGFIAEALTDASAFRHPAAHTIAAAPFSRSPANTGDVTTRQAAHREFGCGYAALCLCAFAANPFCIVPA